MKKILLSIFSSTLLTSNLSLVTSQSIHQQVKVQDPSTKLGTVTDLPIENDLNPQELDQIQQDSITWDENTIDQILNQALQYHDSKLSLDQQKLNLNKIPATVMEHINVALFNLNQAVNNGDIKVMVDHQQVQLVYPTNNKVMDSLSINDNDNDIIDFDNQTNKMTAFRSSYIWYSTYGPSHWWKFWEWGGYIHFSEQAVKDAIGVGKIIDLFNIISFFKNIKNIINLTDELIEAWNIGENLDKINELLKEISDLLGGVVLDKMGDIGTCIATLVSLVSLISDLDTVIAMTGFAGLLQQLITSTLSVIIVCLKNVDQGTGVRWKWANFVIPVGFLAGA